MKTLSNIEPNIHLQFFLLLAFIGGFVDACSFMIFQVFTGHLTGNSVLSMIYISQMDWAMLVLSAVSILGFFAGTLAGSWKQIQGTSLSSHTIINTIVLLLFTIVFTLYFFIPSLYSAKTALFMISLSMGIQNGYFNKVGGVSIHTTYVTGMTTSCIGKFLRNENKDGSKKTLAFAVISFILGALTGGYLSVNYHILGFSTVLILLLITVIYSFRIKL
ncbi:YoaK family protein [Providencia stuartii]|uniref:YoaK family protein n=1 Tax=Providencia stuartii TaxID=588 RepID=UPI0024B26774